MVNLDNATSEIDDENVMKISFFDSLSDLSPKVNGLELTKYT